MRAEDETALPPLKAREDIQKILLSTPTRFTGEFLSPDVIVTHAWPPLYTGRQDWLRHQGSPLGRTALVLSFRTPPPTKAPGVIVPNYEAAGELVASVLSLLFGKRFDSHGPLEMSGHFGVPDLTLFNSPTDPTLPHNAEKVRADHPIPLVLSEIARILPLIVESQIDQRSGAAFHSAAKFYRQALTSIEDDPEVAYLHLITAGEIISGRIPFDEDQHFDDDLSEALRLIESEMPEGKRISNLLRSRLRGIKRRFVSTIVSMVDDQFFERREAAHHFCALRRDDFRMRVAAAYDLRSQYVHTGYAFGRWITLRHQNSEIQAGEPIVPDRNMQKVLYRAPLFGGLERIIRYVLLNFAVSLGADLKNIDYKKEDKDISLS
ncbi:MAG: hypothetical protein H7X93_00345 [Sphingomonadaceae bacterium]|nr:hypothetical protein [Sphingomonadaceae bacterium]